MDPDSINKVDIRGVPGRRGWSDKEQVKVLRNFTINSYSPTNLLDLYTSKSRKAKKPSRKWSSQGM